MKEQSVVWRGTLTLTNAERVCDLVRDLVCQKRFALYIAEPYGITDLWVNLTMPYEALSVSYDGMRKVILTLNLPAPVGKHELISGARSEDIGKLIFDPYFIFTQDKLVVTYRTTSDRIGTWRIAVTDA
jgi:hypothetical protein